MMLLLAVLAAAPAAAPKPTAALIVARPAEADDAAVRAARAELGERFDLESTTDVRAELETEIDPLKLAKAALGRAQQALRRFEMDAARRALAEATERAEVLPPTSEGRSLVVEIAVRKAELERVESRPAEMTRRLGEALSIDPALTLDRDLYAPPLIAQLASAREKREQAQKVTVRVDTVPSGARVYAGGADRCCTPLTLELKAGWQVFWFHGERYRPGMLPVQLSSSGPVSFPLVPQTRAERVRPLVAVLRAAPESERAEAAAALREVLGVEANAVLERPGEAPRVYEKTAEPAAPVAAVTPAPPAATEEVDQGPGFLARKWPALGAVLVAAGLAAAGGVMGNFASQDARAAEAEHFASDGAVKRQAADGKALVANLLFGGAGLFAVVGVVLYFVF